MICSWHLCDNKLTGRKKRYCSQKCKNKGAVTRRRQKIKQMAVEYKGGCCQICSYNKCIAALTFHHIEPEHKDFGIASYGHSRSWERVRKELDKCLLVCANCHAEIHNNVASPEFEELST